MALNSERIMEKSRNWGQASSSKQSECGRHGLSNILKLQATFSYSIYHQRAGKTNLFHMRGARFQAGNTLCRPTFNVDEWNTSYNVSLYVRRLLWTVSLRQITMTRCRIKALIILLKLFGLEGMGNWRSTYVKSVLFCLDVRWTNWFVSCEGPQTQRR